MIVLRKIYDIFNPRNLGCGGCLARLMKLSSTEQIYGVLSCPTARKDQMKPTSPAARGTDSPTRPLETHTPVLRSPPRGGPDCAESPGVARSTPAGRNDTAGVTHRFGRNPSLGRLPERLRYAVFSPNPFGGNQRLNISHATKSNISLERQRGFHILPQVKYFISPPPSPPCARTARRSRSRRRRRPEGAG